MGWVKFRIEVNGRDELLELNYTTFKQSLRTERIGDRVILHEGGITREMPHEEFKDWIVAVISMLDVDDQKEIIDTVAEMIFR